MTGQTFTFTEAGWRNNSTVAYFQYSIETDKELLQLEELLEFPFPITASKESDALLRALHIALGMSYYKSFIPPILTHPYAMTEVEADFWNIVYKNGLGEFLYINNLTPEKLATFTEQDGMRSQNDTIDKLEDAAILGLGGGKDSIVAGELLKEIGIPSEGFVLATGEQLGQTKAVAHTMNIGLIEVKRYVDKKIVEINKIPGAFNGHIPISLIFALVGALLAINNQRKYIVVANEASASIPQATLGNLQINHQWSKSIDFERLFQDYLHAYINKDLSYFSAVRPLTSVAIAKLFSQYPRYFEVFTSDNSLFKIEPAVRKHPRWTPESNKTLSSYILLAPWIQKHNLEKIFGYHYLDDELFKKRVVDLLGGGEPVLDCVGTPTELQSCMAVIAQNKEFTDSSLIKDSDIQTLYTDARPLENFTVFEPDALPQSIKQQIHDKIKEKL